MASNESCYSKILPLPESVMKDLKKGFGELFYPVEPKEYRTDFWLWIEKQLSKAEVQGRIEENEYWLDPNHPLFRRADFKERIEELKKEKTYRRE